jgi:hypothetical protein
MPSFCNHTGLPPSVKGGALCTDIDRAQLLPWVSSSPNRPDDVAVILFYARTLTKARNGALLITISPYLTKRQGYYRYSPALPFSAGLFPVPHCLLVEKAYRFNRYLCVLKGRGVSSLT